jgi:formylglycine-generating enzyme required for sulfatase activity
LDRSRRLVALNRVVFVFPAFAVAGLLGCSPPEPTGAGRRPMVRVPAGWFLMGSETGRADERPARRVYLDAYDIDRYEVTNAQYRAFLEATGRRAPRHWVGGSYPAGTELDPVVGVGWRDACAYCTWAGERLPTEAEWEKACQGTTGSTYPWGNTWDPSRANVRSVRIGQIDDAWAFLVSDHVGDPGLEPVGSYSSGASPYGVMDMVGNASEWVADWYTWNGYKDWPVRNPIGLGPEWNHSIRGSAWFDPHSSDVLADVSRCSARNSSHSYDDPRVGFRCARSANKDDGANLAP